MQLRRRSALWLVPAGLLTAQSSLAVPDIYDGDPARTVAECDAKVRLHPGVTAWFCYNRFFNLTVAGGTLFFTANTPANGMELWKTDASGTALVKDINPGPSGSGPAYFAVLGSKLLFSCLYPGGSMLCSSDGTAARTVSLSSPGVPGDTKNLTTVTNLTPASGVVLFQASGASTSGTSDGNELWAYDGTSVFQVKDVNPGGNGSFPGQFMPVGNKVVFRATTAATGTELWVTDGTPGGTTLLKDIQPGPGNGIPPPFLE